VQVNDRFAVAEPDRFEPWLVYDEVYQPMAGLGSWARRRGAHGHVVDEFRGFESHTHRSWLYDITTPSLIEPRYGRVALVSGEVLDRSFSYSHMGIGPIAESLAELQSWALTRDDVELDCVISMHEPLENNYWHFHDDWLSKLFLVRDFGLESGWPLLVSSHLFRSPLFDVIRLSPYLRDLNWVDQRSVVRASRVVVPVRGSLREGTLRRLGTVLPQPQLASRTRHLLLVRGPERGRHLSNAEAVAAALPWLEPVDADDLSAAEQVELFSSAATVVGVHGASLTNMVYRAGRGLPMTLVELFPANFVHPHFAATARTNDVTWSACVGSELVGGSFSVAVADVVRAVERAHQP
jgi:hypothetical protein